MEEACGVNATELRTRSSQVLFDVKYIFLQVRNKEQRTAPPFFS